MYVLKEVVEVSFEYLPYTLPFASLLMVVGFADHIVIFVKRVIKNAKVRF